MCKCLTDHSIHIHVLERTQSAAHDNVSFLLNEIVVLVVEVSVLIVVNRILASQPWSPLHRVFSGDDGFFRL